MGYILENKFFQANMFQFRVCCTLVSTKVHVADQYKHSLVMTAVMTVVIVMTMGWVSSYDCSHSHDYELELPVMTVVKVMTSSSSQFDCPAVIFITRVPMFEATRPYPSR